MTIALYGLIAFAVVFGGGLLGLLLGRFLPEQYQSDATQRIVQTATGMVSLIAALVLGLLVATAKNKFDPTQPGDGRVRRQANVDQSRVGELRAGSERRKSLAP